MGLLHVLLGRSGRSRLLSVALGVMGLVSGSALSSHAAVIGFTGPYDVSNWTLNSNPKGGDGSINTASAPVSVTITGSNVGDGNSYSTDYTVVAAGNGLVSFDWNYFSFDEADYDTFGYLLNGNFTLLAMNNSQGSGSTQFSVVQGDTFGFRVFSLDSSVSPGVATIFLFPASAPPSGEVPEPTSMAIFGLGALGFAYRNRRKLLARDSKRAINDTLAS